MNEVEENETQAEEETEQVDRRLTRDFLKKFVDSAKDGSKPKRHRKDAALAWSEYENQNTEDSTNERSTSKSKPYAIYWSSCKTIEPAFYSRTPKISTKRRFGVDAPEAILASKGVERLGEYLVDCCNFDEAMTAAVQDFIHADKATTQVSYTADFEEVEQHIPLQQASETVFVTQDGTEYSDEVFQDETGFFGKSIEKQPTNQKILLLPISYKDIIHDPDAKTESEIKIKGAVFCLSREEAENRFDEDVIKQIRWKKGKDADKEDKSYEADDENVQVVEGYEIYDKVTKKAIWVSDQIEGYILDIKDDPYGLYSFFPFPTFQIGSKPSDHMYPTPAYIQVKPQIDNLNDLVARIFKLSSSIRRRALVNGADDDLIDALNNLDDGDYVACSKLQNFLEKGGIEGSIYWIPVQELVQSITELMGLKDEFKNDFFEMFGVPDILRGSSDPLETAAAQTIKERSAHDRFKYMKKQIAMLASDSIQLMVDLALGVFSPEYLAEVIGIKYLSQEEQAMWPQAYELLVNDNARMITIDIDTDSLTFVDEQVRAEQMNNAVNTVMNGLQTVGQMLSEGGNPAIAAVGLKAVMLSLDMLAPGKEFQSGIKAAADDLLEQLNNPPPPQPPPPDYEAMKLEVENQKLQVQMAKMNMEAQARQIENASNSQLKQIELTTKQQTEQVKLALQQQKQQAEEDKAAADIRLKAEAQVYEQQVESRYLELETYKAALSELQITNQNTESMMEEIRLAREADRAQLMSVIEAQRADVEQAKTRPVTVNVVVPKARKKIGRIKMDANGQPSFEIDEPEVTEYQTISQNVDAGSGEATLQMPQVTSRKGSVQYDANDNPTVQIDEVLGRLNNGQ